MTTRIIIQHTSGSKVNQIEQFQLDSTDELSFGRDPGCTVTFDPQRDDAVSRRHAVLKVQKGGERPSFRLTDLGSSNGTRVNGERISGEFELMPGDSVELGAGGPSFTFDLQPRPQNMVARTRLISTAPGAPTRIVDTGVGSGAGTGAAAPPPVPTKVGVGRETVQRLLTEERRSAGRVWMYSLAGILAVLGVVGGGLYYKMRSSNQETTAALSNTQSQLVNTQAALNSAQTALNQTINDTSAEVKRKIGLTPEEIAHKWGNSIVYIEFRWRLLDQQTGRPVYHKRCSAAGCDKKPRDASDLVPAYVMLPNGHITRWLTNEDDGHRNILIGAEGSGTGFVINDQGYLMSNKHVIAGWTVPWLAVSNEYEEGQHIVYEMSDKRFAPIGTDKSAWKDVVSWLPEQGGVIFAPDRPWPLAGSRIYEGKNEKLTMRFPNSRLSVEGRLVRASTDADVALGKIDSLQQLSFAEMASDNVIKVGEHVTVLGYPGFSAKTIALLTTIEAGQVHQREEIIPQPTVTDGLVARLGSGEQQQGVATTVGDMGDVYQLSVATGEGNSGGPVFDAAGKVIGLFTYRRGNRETTTFAVPIKYARDLLQVQQVN